MTISGEPRRHRTFRFEPSARRAVRFREVRP
jgi:hypothetical protein